MSMLEEHKHKHPTHDFDGITENRTNRPPAYFSVLFYGLILWGTIFSAYYLLSGWSSDAEFAAKMADHQQQVAEQKPSGPQAAAAAPQMSEEELLNEGKELFAQHCAACHGAAGEGGIGPALDGADYAYGADREAVHLSIAKGREGGMPAFGSQLSATQLEALTGFVLSLQPSGSAAAPAPAAGEPAAEEPAAAAAEGPDAAELYAGNCAACHGADGRGGIGPDLGAGEYKFGKDDAAILESIANGRPGGMPAFGARLSEAQLLSLVEFLKSL
ncbi:c-type cytochrome [Desulfuromonas versatilis]|uniref:C-type cytochrome n=1 Tax=Desulfuromonas versatilis TaxID=2802975 RepID=A0ABM8HS38_9BACT|nr:c-type cytochrome [Desulfuromonas versatilis]BCR03412.1 c-type cytochrome [Desulfuromonas versatilis]